MLRDHHGYTPGSAQGPGTTIGTPRDRQPKNKGPPSVLPGIETNNGSLEFPLHLPGPRPRFEPKKGRPDLPPEIRYGCSVFLVGWAQGFPHNRGLVWPRSLTLSPRLDGPVITLASKAQARAIMAAPRSQTGRVPGSASNGSKLNE